MSDATPSHLEGMTVRVGKVFTATMRSATSPDLRFVDVTLVRGGRAGSLLVDADIAVAVAMWIASYPSLTDAACGSAGPPEDSAASG